MYVTIAIAASFFSLVENIDARNAQRLPGAYQVCPGDHFLPHDRAEIIHLQLRGGRFADAVAEMVFDRVPGGFIRDGRGDAAVQHAAASSDTPGSRSKCTVTPSSCLLRDAQVHVVLEGHFGRFTGRRIVAEQRAPHDLDGRKALLHEIVVKLLQAKTARPSFCDSPRAASGFPACPACSTDTSGRKCRAWSRDRPSSCV